MKNFPSNFVYTTTNFQYLNLLPVSKQASKIPPCSLERPIVRKKRQRRARELEKGGYQASSSTRHLAQRGDPNRRVCGHFASEIEGGHLDALSHERTMQSLPLPPSFLSSFSLSLRFFKPPFQDILFLLSLPTLTRDIHEIENSKKSSFIHSDDFNNEKYYILSYCLWKYLSPNSHANFRIFFFFSLSSFATNFDQRRYTWNRKFRSNRSDLTWTNFLPLLSSWNYDSSPLLPPVEKHIHEYWIDRGNYSTGLKKDFSFVLQLEIAVHEIIN